jgi:hypothetical protein
MGSGWSITKGKNGTHRSCGDHTALLDHHVNDVEAGRSACPPGPGQAAVAAHVEPPELPQEKINALMLKAAEWAYDCGFIGKLAVDEPVKMKYPLWGHGWSVLVREETGKGRRGTCRFNAAGERSYWSIDSYTL